GCTLDRGRADPPARKRDEAVDLVLEIVRADDAPRGEPALAMPDQPERLDVLLAELGHHRVDDAVEIVIVGFCNPYAAARRAIRARPDRQRGRGRDDEAIFLGVVGGREIAALPVTDRSRAMKVEDEGDLLAWLQVAGIVEEEGTLGVELGRLADEGL